MRNLLSFSLIGKVRQSNVCAYYKEIYVQEI